ncbi:hypothetical protein ENSA7_54720 [Enhygromyxa salina]|uniref:Uncharacterized protein n=1 Tax=Enhygromyxa salina TaxID=215803 RepID=A0A2S9YC16_9BACT|nr:hypothetical protein ENSA7_54720 [Enhygromyxa salina]
MALASDQDIVEPLICAGCQPDQLLDVQGDGTRGDPRPRLTLIRRFAEVQVLAYERNTACSREVEIYLPISVRTALHLAIP